MSTGCKISLKGNHNARKSEKPQKNEEKPHIIVSADTAEKVERGVELVLKILKGEPEELD
jgi:hypothetical protein